MCCSGYDSWVQRGGHFAPQVLCLGDRWGRGTPSPGPALKDSMAPRQVCPQRHAKIFHTSLATQPTGWTPRSAFTEKAAEEGAMTLSWLGCQRVLLGSYCNQPVIYKWAHGRVCGIWLGFFIFLLGERAPHSLLPAHLPQQLKNFMDVSCPTRPTNFPHCLLGWYGRGFCSSPHPSFQGTEVSYPIWHI